MACCATCVRLQHGQCRWRHQRLLECCSAWVVPGPPHGCEQQVWVRNDAMRCRSHDLEVVKQECGETTYVFQPNPLPGTVG